MRCEMMLTVLCVACTVQYHFSFFSGLAYLLTCLPLYIDRGSNQCLHSKQNEIPALDPDILKDKLRKYLSKETKEERAEKFRNTFWGYNATFLSRMENGTRVHNEKGTPLAPGTIFQFHNLKRHLQNFEIKTGFKLTFENIDLYWQ